jgi:hypothetical protein
MGKYFTVEVKPTITASKQALGAFATDDLVFDWTAFDVPKGTNKLIDAVVVSRGTNGARQDFQLDYHFAKSRNGNAPASLGTLNGGADGTGYYNDLIGAFTIGAGDFYHGLDNVSVGSIGRTGTAHGEVVQPCLTGEPDSGTNVGYDKLYIAGLGVAGGPNYASTVQVATETATSTSALVVKTTSALTCFDVGDILHDENDQLIGTIKSITDATNIVLEENAASVSAVDKDLYNIKPITIILSFEK